MQTLPTESNLPRCFSRLAKPGLRWTTLILLSVILWPATAMSQLFPVDSENQFAAPTGRLQQRHTSELRNLGDLPNLDWKPVLLVAAELCNEVSSLQQSLETEHQLAMLQDAVRPDTADQEQIKIGREARDRCFVAVPLSEVRANIATPDGKLPEDVAALCRQSTTPTSDARLTCGWAVYEKHWAATCMHHRPLYFEEVNAERYGYTPGHRLQPFISAGRFLATIPALPYLMVARPQRERIYTLGHYRPGDCVPYRWHRPPCCVGAGVVEAAVIVGLVALVP